MSSAQFQLLKRFHLAVLSIGLLILQLSCSQSSTLNGGNPEGGNPGGGNPDGGNPDGEPAQVATPQNVLFIMLDDADFHDFSFYDDTQDVVADAVTPNLDMLRAGGRLLSNYYTASAICTPTRASVLTGTSPLAFGAFDAWPQNEQENMKSMSMGGLPNGIPQLGKLMQQSGRATGHFGKWHVGLTRPEYRHAALGFDSFSYHVNVQDAGPPSWQGEFEFVNHDGREVVDVDHIDSYYTDKVIDFINKSVSDNTPFFLNFWPLTPHFPWTPPRNFDNSTTNFNLETDRGNVLAMMYAIDQEIGRIVETLRDHEILNSTLLIVTSDNGGVGSVRNSTSTLRGGKGTFFEGGVKLPLLLHWPEGISSNSSNQSVVVSYDILPTLLDIVGVSDVDLGSNLGASKKTAFMGNEIQEHEPVVWQLTGHPTRRGQSRAQHTYAMRKGDYKLVKRERIDAAIGDEAFNLYDLSSDRSESTDIAEQHPVVFDQLRNELLSRRFSDSLVEQLPSEVTGKSVDIPFVASMDVGARGMHLSFDLEVMDGVEARKNIYVKDGSQRVYLNRNRQLIWSVYGVGEDNEAVDVELRSPPLTNAKNSIVLSIEGFKSDVSTFELYVDDVLVDKVAEDAGVEAVNSNTNSVSFGSEGLAISGAAFHTMKFWPDEWKELSQLEENGANGN